MTLELEYGPDIKQHKTSYGGLGLVGYADNNYNGDTKNRRLTMGYHYCLNRVAVS